MPYSSDSDRRDERSASEHHVPKANLGPVAEARQFHRYLYYPELCPVCRAPEAKHREGVWVLHQQEMERRKAQPVRIRDLAEEPK
jgi:hypothetical protein